MTQVFSSTCQTAASSPVSVPTRSCANGAACGCSASSCLQHRRRQLAAAAAAVGELGQADHRVGDGGDGHAETPRRMVVPAASRRQASARSAAPASTSAAVVPRPSDSRTAPSAAAGVDAERQQHRRRRLAAGVAGRAGRGDDPRGRADQRPPRHGRKEQVQGVRQPLGALADEHEPRHLRPQPRQQQAGQPREPRAGLGERLARQPAGDAEPDDAGHVLGPRPQPPLLPGPDDHRPQAHPAPHEERADALRGVELVSGDRQEVDAERRHVDRHLAERLRRVGMDQRPGRAGQRRRRGDRLQRADLVLGVDQRDEPGRAVDRPREVVRVEHAVGARRHPPHAAAGALEQRAAGLGRRMLDRARHHRRAVGERRRRGSRGCSPRCRRR